MRLPWNLSHLLHVKGMGIDCFKLFFVDPGFLKVVLDSRPRPERLMKPCIASNSGVDLKLLTKKGAN